MDATIPAVKRTERAGGSLARSRFQRGSIFLRGKRPVWVGRWWEDFRIGEDIERIRCSKVIGTKAELPTKRLAERRFELLLNRINLPSYRPGRVATVADFAERWRMEILSARKPSTRQSAESHLQHHIIPWFGKNKLDEIGVEWQQKFVNDLSKKVSRKSLLNIVGTLSSMLGVAKKWGYICEPVSTKDLVLPERSIRRQSRFLTADQARDVIASAAEPYRTMFAIAAMTGLRAGEIAGLSLDDLDLERGLIFVRRSAWRGRLQSPKSAGSEAVLPMPSPLSAMLKSFLENWRSNDLRLLFVNRKGKPVDPEKIVRKQLRPILASLGIPRCGFHAFRHTHTSLLLAAGAPPTVTQAQLRHADPKITLGIYGHVIGDSQRQAVERVAEVLAPNRLNSQPPGKWLQ